MFKINQTHLLIMLLRKFIGFIVLFNILITGVIGADIYLTINALSDINNSASIGTPTIKTNDANTTVTISVWLSLPSAGFIPKGIELVLIMIVGSEEFRSTPIMINIGENRTLDVIIDLTDQITNTINSIAIGTSLSATIKAEVSPTVLGFTIVQAKQTLDLGSQQII